MLEIGVLLLACALLCVFAARALFQRPAPPRWALQDTPTNLIVVAITALAGFGLAATGIGIAGLLNGSTSPLHAVIGVALLALLIGGPLAYRKFHRQPPRRAA